MREDPRSVVPRSFAPQPPDDPITSTDGAIGVGRSGARRIVRLTLPFALAAGFVTYMAAEVPVENLAEPPVLTGSEIALHWPIAALGLVAVLALDAVTIGFGLRRRPADVTGSSEPLRGIRIPLPLRVEKVPGWVLMVTTLISVGVLIGAIYLGQPLWQKVLWTLIPWAPVLAFEGVWKFKHYGFYAAFLGLAALQVGHLGEHTTQVAQLLMYDGDVSRSHGVFGQLDFESVHFVWDTAVWVGGGVLVFKYWGNRWLWVSWAVASLHQVEHIYLFSLNQLDNDLWARGGVFGIMGEGGLVGSPLPRPYLHFAYNFLVVVPMLFGLWRETMRIRDWYRPRAGIDGVASQASGR